ncbi:MAG: polyphosphate kinase 1 [Ferruginibacter sp.]|nr:polyphosphate kinase 1 [Ferruginibacter sp.]
MNNQYFNRDLSWLSFNGRVLAEAGNGRVPLVERIKFLSIFSSNLDEFYRVRMPEVLSFKKKNKSGGDDDDIASNARRVIAAQQEYFGKVLSGEILPQLREKNVHIVYNETMPEVILASLEEYFFSAVAAFLQKINLSGNKPDFFSENNQLYQVVILEGEKGKEEVSIIPVPSDNLSRFFSVRINAVQYIVFLEDIICRFLPAIFPGAKIKGVFNIKITRDADLDLEDEFSGDLAEKIETKIAKRDQGSATRFLYEPGIPLRILQWLVATLQLTKANVVEGGKYHNLKDFAGIPNNDPALLYASWPAIKSRFPINDCLFQSVIEKDRIIHTPYESYNTILRFFNEAAIDPEVEEIFVTLYRIASDSKIANALITAARNGKKVTVFVELKARFDEANNIRWGKKMKAAGIRIIYSIPNLKVHAKVALVKRRQQGHLAYLGLLSTGNMNESTARFYTDHILLTTHHGLLEELELLFIFLSQKRKPVNNDEILFKHLLVAQFNLQTSFFSLIDNEIKNARQGLPAAITIKLNNLEEKKMISKLYEASEAGVNIQLIVRSICCLKPGPPGSSDHIKLTRIVDKYLEHGRVFIFNNNNHELFFLGSADWMNRNIYSRIEVCFPVYDESIQSELKQIIDIQLADNVQAVQISELLENIPVKNEKEPVRSQEKIYQLLGSGVRHE